MLSDSKKESFYSFIRANAVIGFHMEESLKNSECATIREYDVLVTLEMAPKRSLRMNDLARRVIYSRSGLTRLIDRLEKRGLVSRTRCTDDGRGLYCTITDKGVAVREQTWPIVREAMVNFYAELVNDEESTKISQVCNKILEKLNG